MGMGDDINAIIRTCPPPRDGESEVGPDPLSAGLSVSFLHPSVGVPSERCHPGRMGWQFGGQAVLRRLQLRDHHERECSLLRRLENTEVTEGIMTLYPSCQRKGQQTQAQL